jgi:hypothetical protein
LHPGKTVVTWLTSNVNSAGESGAAPNAVADASIASAIRIAVPWPELPFAFIVIASLRQSDPPLSQEYCRRDCLRR